MTRCWSVPASIGQPTVPRATQSPTCTTERIFRRQSYSLGFPHLSNAAERPIVVGRYQAFARGRQARDGFQFGKVDAKVFRQSERTEGHRPQIKVQELHVGYDSTGAVTYTPEPPSSMITT